MSVWNDVKKIHFISTCVQYFIIILSFAAEILCCKWNLNSFAQFVFPFLFGLFPFILCILYTRCDAAIHFQFFSLSAWAYLHDCRCTAALTALTNHPPTHQHTNFMQIKWYSIMLSFYHYPVIFTSLSL